MLTPLLLIQQSRALIVQVVLLWGTALFGCCILACVTIYCGYIIGATWYVGVNGDVGEVLKVVQERRQRKREQGKLL